MVKIIDNKEITITKLSNKVKFHIKKTTKHAFFYKKVKDILGEKTNEFTLNARKITSLNDYLKSNSLLYKHAITLFISLFTQIKDMESNNKTVYLIDLSDIFFIELNEHHFYFLLLKTDKIKEIKNGYLEMNEPLEKKDSLFISPELKNQTNFPFKLSYKSCYYSLGMIVSHSLNKITKTFDLSKHIEDLKETPLYWALERCLTKNVENRTLLYI